MGFVYYNSRFLAKKGKPTATFDEELRVAKINSFSNFIRNFNSFDKQPTGNSRHICGLKLSKKSHANIFSTVIGQSSAKMSHFRKCAKLAYRKLNKPK